jgi:hypothetical protein
LSARGKPVENWADQRDQEGEEQRGEAANVFVA